MKLNKKVMGLLVAGMLAVPFVGCSDNNVTEELPQTQIEEQQPQEQEQPQQEQQEQQKPVDEDLNNQYKAKINASDVQKAKEILDPILSENFGANGYTIMTYEEDNGVVIVIDLKISDLQTATIDEWNYLVDVMTELQLSAQQYVQQQGLNVSVSLMVGDINADEPLLAIANGEVMFDIVNGIDRIN